MADTPATTDERTETPPRELTREYVAGGTQGAYARAIRALPHYIDDLTRDLGDDLYDRMLVDPQIISAVNTFKAAVLEDGVHLASAIADEHDGQYAQAQEIVQFCQTVLDGLTTPLNVVLWDLLDAIVYGNKVAEEVYALRNGKLVLTALKVKPRRTIAFVVDAYLNVLGLTARMPDQPGASVHVAGSATGTVPNLLPREKFAILTFRPKDSDPRGTSILRAAYNAWWLKMQSWPELLKFLAQFGSPSLVGITAEDAEGSFDKDENGNDIPETWQTAEQRLLAALLEFRNGTALALPHGASANALDVSDSNAFDGAIALFNREIMIAILHQTLATGEGEHASRAQAGVHQDTLGWIIKQSKQLVEWMLRTDVLRPLVRYNFGAEAEALTPQPSLGAVAQQDLTPLMTAVAALERAGYFDDDQRPEVDTKLGLPQRKHARRDQAQPNTNDASDATDGEDEDGQ